MRTGEGISISSLAREYRDVLDYVLTRGRKLESRVGVTTELLGLNLEIDLPEMCIVQRRGFSHQFLDAEILLICAGRYSDKLLRASTPKAADLITQATAYGPRTRDQLRYVERELRERPESRRGTVVVADRYDLKYSMDPKMAQARADEMPCTCTWQFILRDGMLHMIVYMRSWDLVWGMSYDVPCFVAIQVMMAKALGAEVGRYSHFAGSAHIYHAHMDAVESASPNMVNAELRLPFVLDKSLSVSQDNAGVEVSNRLRKIHAKETTGV